jgi:zinc protease
VHPSQLGRGLELLDSLTFADNGYRWPVSGAPADLSALTAAQCRDWYASRYTPDRAVIVIAGPSAHADNLRLVERYFGHIKGGRPAARTAAAGGRGGAGPVKGTLESGSAQFPLLLVGYRTPPDSSADGPVMDVIARLLAGGTTSLLGNALVDGDRLAFFAGATNTARRSDGLFYALAGLRAGADRDSLESVLGATIEGVADRAWSDDDLARAQSQLETQFWFGLDTVQDRASALGSATLVDGDPDAFARRLARWRAVKKEDVMRVAHAYLNPSHRATVWVVAPARSGS